jgi:large subunit ribosomal protein L18
MDRAKEKRLARQRRHMRVRKRVSGTAERPRLCVFRSLRHIYAQLIDDARGQTLVSAATVDAEVRAGIAPSEGHKIAQAKAVGQVLAQRAAAAGIQQVVFDRGGYPYHGRVRALAEGAREGGLEF